MSYTHMYVHTYVHNDEYMQKKLLSEYSHIESMIKLSLYTYVAFG